MDLRDPEVTQTLDHFKAAMAIASDDEARYGFIAGVADKLERLGDDGSAPFDDVYENAVTRHGLDADRVQEAMARGSERARDEMWSKPANGSNGHANGFYRDHLGRLREKPEVKEPAPKLFSASDLEGKEFPPLRYIVPEVIPEGLTLVVSRPKLGKSWLALDVAIAIAAGRFVLGDKQPDQGSVLYIALEDSEARLQRRIAKLKIGRAHV